MVKDGVFSSWKGHRATTTRPFFLTSIPRSATTAESSFAALMRSIPSLLTCISPLLLPERLESQALQAGDLGLQEAQVDQRRTTVVLALHLLHALSLDAEDGQPPPVDAAHLYAAKLTAAGEPEGAQVEVLGHQHGITSRAAAPRSALRGNQARGRGGACP